MYLFFDTETSDLPRNYNAPETDTRNWPRLVQLAWIECDGSQSHNSPQVHLIKPEGFVIAHGAFQRHNISTEHATKHGVSLRPVLESFLAAVDKSEIVIAHNIEFDANIIGAECVRARLANPLRRKQMRCTMKESTNYCRIPGQRGFKWPTLTELHSNLFNIRFDNAHDAATDCTACMRCFFRLQELAVIS